MYKNMNMNAKNETTYDRRYIYSRCRALGRRAKVPYNSVILTATIAERVAVANVMSSADHLRTLQIGCGNLLEYFYGTHEIIGSIPNEMIAQMGESLIATCATGIAIAPEDDEEYCESLEQSIHEDSIYYKSLIENIMFERREVNSTILSYCITMLFSKREMNLSEYGFRFLIAQLNTLLGVENRERNIRTIATAITILRVIDAESEYEPETDIGFLAAVLNAVALTELERLTRQPIGFDQLDDEYFLSNKIEDVDIDDLDLDLDDDYFDDNEF